jgi:hypothetical protein
LILLYGGYLDVLEMAKSLVYLPYPDWYGVEVFTISVFDNGNIGVFKPYNLTRTILLDYEQVPDTPKITQPLASQALGLWTIEDMTGIIGIDCCGWLRENYGTSVLNISTSSFFISDADTKLTKQTAGRFVARNSTMNRNVVTNDFSVNKNIHPTNYSIQRVGLTNYTYGSVTASDFYSYVYDTNQRDELEDSTMTVKLRCHHGILTLPRVSESIVFIEGSGFQEDYFVFSGPLDEINLALRGLIYLPDINWNSNKDKFFLQKFIYDYEIIEIEVIDVTGLKAYEKIEINVKASNDKPNIAVGLLSVYDSYQLISTDQLSKVRIAIQPLLCDENSVCPISDVTIRDVDVNENFMGYMRVKLSCNNGTISFDSSSPNIVSQINELILSHGK